MTSRRRHVLLALTAAAGIGILATGWSAVSRSTPSPSAGGTRVVIAGQAKLDEAADSVTLPLDKYLGPTDSIVNHAQDLVIQKCMEAKGFPFQISSFTGIDAAAQQWRSFGLWNPTEARKYGYGLAPDPVLESDRALNPNMSAAAVAAVDPCIHESNALFPGPDQMARYSAGNLSNEALFDTLADAKGKSLISRWQNCMTAQGIKVASKGYGPLGADIDIDTLSTTKQIAIAVKDVECKSKNNVIQQLADIDASYQQVLIAAHQRDLNQQLAQTEAVHKAAAATIAEHS
jgi:hypothetical protein